jgi:hypothetical protein
MLGRVHAYAAEAKDSPKALVEIPALCGAIAIGALLVLRLAVQDLVPTRWQHLVSLPGVVTVYLLVYRVAWNRWLWRLKPVQAWFGLPNLRGTWVGDVEPDPASHLGPGRVALQIDQRWLTIRIHFDARLDAIGHTRYAESDSTMAAIVNDNGGLELRYEYRVADNPLVPTHSGVAHLRLDDERRPDVLYGVYYTDRNGDPQHWGTLREFRRVSDRILPATDAFAAA